MSRPSLLEPIVLVMIKCKRGENFDLIKFSLCDIYPLYVLVVFNYMHNYSSEQCAAHSYT